MSREQTLSKFGDYTLQNATAFLNQVFTDLAVEIDQHHQTVEEDIIAELLAFAQKANLDLASCIRIWQHDLAAREHNLEVSYDFDRLPYAYVVICHLQTKLDELLPEQGTR